MSKFRVKVKLTGFEVEGDSNYGAPQIAQNISKQLGRVIEPIALIEDDEVETPATPHVVLTPENGSRPRKRKSVSKGVPASASSQPLTWNHDTEKWGTPMQTWKSPQKIMWLLYVIGEATGNDKFDMNPTEIAETFHDKFRSAGKLTRQNISRDLGRNSEEFAEMNGRWFLKQKGRDEAKKLIAESLGTASAANA